MNSLFNKPNLLFLIFVRNQNRAFLLSKLRRPIYRTKLIKALTVVIKTDLGTKYWYINGKKHREDGPAVIIDGIVQSWFKNDKLHRENGPAIIFRDGIESWWLNDKRHREDGPAIIDSNGEQEWWIHGKRVEPF